MGFSKQDYWSGLPFLPPGDLPDPGIEPTSLASPALAGGFFTTSATGEAQGSQWNPLRIKKPEHCIKQKIIVVGWIIAPEDVWVLIHRTCNYVTRIIKGNLQMWGSVNLDSWKVLITLDYPGGPGISRKASRRGSVIRVGNRRCADGCQTLEWTLRTGSRMGGYSCPKVCKRQGNKSSSQNLQRGVLLAPLARQTKTFVSYC